MFTETLSAPPQPSTKPGFSRCSCSLPKENSTPVRYSKVLMLLKNCEYLGYPMRAYYLNINSEGSARYWWYRWLNTLIQLNMRRNILEWCWITHLIIWYLMRCPPGSPWHILPVPRLHRACTLTFTHHSFLPTAGRKPLLHLLNFRPCTHCKRFSPMKLKFEQNLRIWGSSISVLDQIIRRNPAWI